MPTHIGIGFSQDFDVSKAGYDAALQSRINLQSNVVDLTIVFSTVHYDPYKSIPSVYQVIKNNNIIGCSTAGIILSDSIQTRGIGVLTIASDEIKFGLGCMENVFTDNAYQSGVNLAQKCTLALEDKHRHTFLFFLDNNLTENSQVLKGIREVLGKLSMIVGGASCDDFRFVKNFQIFQNRILNNALVGVLFGGHLSVGASCHHGWKPLGRPRVIDKVKGNTILTIDGKPASKIYEEFLGSNSKNLHATPFGRMAILYPLGILSNQPHHYLLRNVIDVFENGAILCQGDVPEGSEVHIMISDKNYCMEAATQAAQEAKNNLMGKKPGFIIVIESLARLKLFGRSAFQEIKKIKEIFGPDVPIIGMYANGEAFPSEPFEKMEKAYFQNESIIILAFS